MIEKLHISYPLNQVVKIYIYIKIRSYVLKDVQRIQRHSKKIEICFLVHSYNYF